MVDVLLHREIRGAIPRRPFNDLGKTHKFSLLCAYAMENTQPGACRIVSRIQSSWPGAQRRYRSRRSSRARSRDVATARLHSRPRSSETNARGRSAMRFERERSGEPPRMPIVARTSSWRCSARASKPLAPILTALSSCSSVEPAETASRRSSSGRFDIW